MLNRLRKVFATLHSHDVRYVVIGGIAAILHGVPRATFDLDILIDATPENAGRLLAALSAGGFGTASLTDVESILANEITIFDDFVRLDVQISTPGLTFADAWAHRVEMEFEGQVFHVASRYDVIASKSAAGQPRDLEDVRALESDAREASSPRG